jgi:hypothetical protein
MTERNIVTCDKCDKEITGKAFAFVKITDQNNSNRTIHLCTTARNSCYAQFVRWIEERNVAA